MRKILIAVVTALVSTAGFAWGDREQGALIGIVVGNAIANRQVYQSPPVVYTQPQIIYVPAPVYQLPPQYRFVDIYDPYCNCYRSVMVRNY